LVVKEELGQTDSLQSICAPLDWRKMRISRVLTTLGCISLAMTATSWAQTRKAGLWEITSTVTLQQSPFPPGMDVPSTSPLSAGPHVAQVCLTQAMIDKYGAPVPESRTECQLANVQKGEHGMTADLVCSGRMSGKGTLESSWLDPEHAKGTIHFTGTVQAGPNPRPIEWTRQSTSVFKSDDCGDVKPVELPANK
jgi:uncharacterized protein DUF3617